MEHTEENTSQNLAPITNPNIVVAAPNAVNTTTDAETPANLLGLAIEKAHAKLFKKVQDAAIDAFEVYGERTESMSLDVKDSKLDSFSQSTNQGLCFRVLKDQRTGFAYSFDLSESAIDQAITTAIETAELMAPNELLTKEIFERSASYGVKLVPGNMELADNQARQLTFEELKKIPFALEALAKEASPVVARVHQASFSQSVGETFRIDSTNKLQTYIQTGYGASVEVVAQDGTEQETASEYQGSTKLSNINLKQIAEQAAKNLEEIFKAGSIETMQCPAIFKNSVMAQLIGFLADSFSAENIDKNFSMLQGKLGEKIFADCLTIVDDGVLRHGLGSSPFDDEGNPRQTTTLVDKGVVKNFLTDRLYSKKLNLPLTGHAQRGSLKSPPTIGCTNLYIKKGEQSLDALIENIEKGVYITDLLGLHTANAVTGEFSVGALGVLIENGKRTRPVRGFAIAGNILELLASTEAVANDLQFWGSVGACAAKFPRLSVSGN